MTIPQEAIEAAAEVLANGLLAGGWDSCSAWERESFYESANDILTAALPALERQIRDQVAESIERKLCGCGNNSPLCEINNTHFTLAAQIARGKDQP